MYYLNETQNNINFLLLIIKSFINIPLLVINIRERNQRRETKEEKSLSYVFLVSDIYSVCLLTQAL